MLLSVAPATRVVSSGPAGTCGAALDPLLTRSCSSSSHSNDAQPLVVPMPKLSHHMHSGRISKWLVGDGDVLRPYMVLAEISTESLVEDAYALDEFAGGFDV